MPRANIEPSIMNKPGAYESEQDRIDQHCDE
jgi:hypothetical protein